MRALRAGAVLVLSLGLLVAASRASATVSSPPESDLCSAAALSAALTGALRVVGVSGFGCASGWAYLWATVGTGAAEVSVTEVLDYDRANATWRIANRGSVCTPQTLPALVYRQGCFSN